MQSILKCCAGLDVHKMMVMATVQTEDENGEIKEIIQSFKTYRRERRKLRDFLVKHQAELVVMESTGVYWKCVHETLIKADLKVWVVNARHVKNVPGRKTDVQDSQWLAILGRCGLLRPSFVPPPDIEQLRSCSRSCFCFIIRPMRQKYPSDISREQFEPILPILESSRKTTKPRNVDLYDVFCAVLYLLKSGCQWRMIPKDFPKWRTVHS